MSSQATSDVTDVVRILLELGEDQRKALFESLAKKPTAASSDTKPLRSSDSKTTPGSETTEKTVDSSSESTNESSSSDTVANLKRDSIRAYSMNGESDFNSSGTEDTYESSNRSRRAREGSAAKHDALASMQPEFIKMPASLKEFGTNKEPDVAEESTASSASAVKDWSREVLQATALLQAALANLEVTADAFKKDQIQKHIESGVQADQTPSNNPSVKFAAQAAAIDAADAAVKAATQMKSQVANLTGNLIDGQHPQQAQPQVLTNTSTGEDITKKKQDEAFKQLGRKIRENEQAQSSVQAAAAASALASGLGMPSTMAGLPQQSVPVPNCAANGFGAPPAMLQGWPTAFPGMGFEEAQAAQAQHTQQKLRLAHALGEGLQQGMMPTVPTVPQPGADVLPFLAAQARARAAATAAAATWQTQNQFTTAAIAAAAAANNYSLKGPMVQAQLAQAAMAAAAGDFVFPSPNRPMKLAEKSRLLLKKKPSQRPIGAGDASLLRSVEAKAKKDPERPTEGAKLTQYPLPFTEDTLRSHLQALQDKDPQCVLIVRKINRLGFESPNVLSAHFSSYGQVEHVFVAHSHVRCQNRGVLAARLRPSGLGFLVMALKEDAEKIMQDGDEHTVQGVSIKVQRFEKRADILAEETGTN